MLKPFFSFFYFLDRMLQRPTRVLMGCLALAFFSLVIQGTLYQLWNLNSDLDRFTNLSIELIEKNKNLDHQLSRTQDISVIEFEARNRFDLVEKDDLVFVFTQ